jgi:hypothetical protein
MDAFSMDSGAQPAGAGGGGDGAATPPVVVVSDVPTPTKDEVVLAVGDTCTGWESPTGHTGYVPPDNPEAFELGEEGEADVPGMLASPSDPLEGLVGDLASDMRSPDADA